MSAAAFQNLVLRREAEEWEKIEGFPYWISDQGDVFSEHSDRILSPYTNESNTYLVIDLRSNGKRKQQLVHGLVMKYHGPDRPPGHEIHHQDGDPTNNAISNLQWVEPEKNVGEAQGEGGAFAPMDAPF